ncbi:phage terminase large subunit [Dehalobacter sp. TeCB1]|uniref:phage terminase large subunit n=1 Tax=Dehalobacter sp. TeCB1 TaxID=1843715 RepID=UPI00083A5F52|nr:phage terminase large subunit [Dehalobacter sp. TeCB1]OCZ54322.1 hypothetical protein A7D23_06015 [Dehalobacter sp. TeCB1]
MDITVQYEPNAKQATFHACSADEAVYGGAKGGGKSCALVMEALAYGLENAGAEMYIFRETYDDLEANIIREWKEKVPRELYSYNESKHFAALINGTVVKFRYIRNYADAEGYQGRSMDWIGVDELTKHEKRSIQVLLSCLRSPKGFKPRFRGTCNPGGIGHSWVKEDYIEATGYGVKEMIDPVTGNKRAFIPAKVYDNDVLMKNDPAYVRRLENLPEDQKKAFLYGDWDIFTGQYFGEFRRDIHVIDPFVIPDSWRRYLALDYGLDMLAAYWIAVDDHQKAYVYKELYQSGLIVSQAAEAIIGMTNETIYQYIAPPDLWNKNRDTGKSTAEIFGDNGIWLAQADNNRVQGWYNLKEWLKPYEDEQESKTASLVVTNNCANLIRTLPQLQYDEKNPNDVATEPHELTHGPDAIRYFIAGRPCPKIPQKNGQPKRLIDQLKKKSKVIM